MNTSVRFSNGATDPAWLLQGPPGSELNELVFLAVAAGLRVERARDGYRVNGASTVKGDLAEIVVEAGDSFGFGPELPPAGKVAVYSLVEPPRPVNVTVTTVEAGKETKTTRAAPRDDYSPRVTMVHGQTVAAHGLIAGAIDHGLTVSKAGEMRFEVHGPLARHVLWLSATQGITLDDAEAAFTPGEDVPAQGAFVDLPQAPADRPRVEVPL